MTTSRPQPLFYQSSKCVAMYLEANIRFQLFVRCPRFRTVHQTATFRIPDLKMRPHDFKINDTTFTLGVIQKYTTTPTPETVKLQNASGGIQYDVDKYGLKSEDGLEENRDANILAYLKRHLLWMVADRERRGLDVDPDLDLRIEERQLEVLAYQMRMTNQEPPFTQYLQLTITTGTVQKVERVEYNKNLKSTRDYILGKIFGVDKVQVGNLQIGEDKFDSHFMFFLQFAEEGGLIAKRQSGNAFYVYTLNGQVEPLLPVPEGKLEIGEMRVTGNLKNALASIKSCLSERNPPIKKLACVYQPFPNDPIVQAAKFLCIVGKASLKVFEGNFSNNRIHLERCDILETDFMNLVNKWETEKNEVSRFYSIGFNKVKEIERFFEILRNVPGAETGKSYVSR
ncbi:hypothetical protein CRE_12069 [Caenorhabditis remanei]|uniref:Uncharacterized protein n=1 Tax=Caenorhabditis remanei TaxID=31234 RepID=E3MPQ9_CAERE|nr:hypothetical protein CRE_12069 [Caenorhabditis remanei]